MSGPPPLPTRKSENRPAALDLQATQPDLAPPLPMFAPPPLPPRKVIAESNGRTEIAGERSKASVETQPVEATALLVADSSRTQEVEALPETINVGIPQVAAAQPPVQARTHNQDPRLDERRDQQEAEAPSFTLAQLESRPQHDPAADQEVEVPREIPSVPKPSTAISRRSQDQEHEKIFQNVSTKSTPIPLSATTQTSSRPPPPPLPARRPEDKFAKFHTPPEVTDNQDPYIPLPLPSLPVVILLTIPITLAYFQIDLLGLILASLGSWYVWAEWKRKKLKRTEYGPEVDRDKVKGLKPRWQQERYKDESVNWMNHALRALFPLINTDILTPFIDLVEDALLTQVPPIVSSVRLVSPSLGEEPIQIVSMRPMSDAEWFDNLSRAPSAPANKHGKFMGTLDTVRRKLGSSSAAGDDPGRGDAALDRGQDARIRSMEVEERKKRDRVLRRIGGRRGQGVGVEPGREHATEQQKAGPKGHADFSEGTHIRGEEDTNKDDGDDPDGGEYVNFAVDFSYDGRKNRNGWDLHFLCYIGIGMKGIGGAELPIWVEMLKITGTMHVRLLLAPDVPFVRTASISLPQLPEFDLALKPIKDISLDFFGLPFLKPFMEKAILEVAGGFVRPNCYKLDVDRILLGQEAALRTEAMGVLHIRIHRAENLKAADTFGSSDPYATVAFSKLSKPVFSTRTIVGTLQPRWEEDAYVLVTADAIESGERVRIVVYDSDRFSADDAIGMVDVDLADLLEKGNGRQKRNELMEENTELKPTRQGMPAQGRLFWSHAFYPLWKMPEDDKQKTAIGEEEWTNAKCGDNDIGTGREGQAQVPGLIYSLMGQLKPEPFPWEAERRKRRLESIAWLTGERARETFEASVKPSLERRSGILQFSVKQCINLEYQRTGKTFSSQSDKRSSSAAGGRPALEGVVDSMAWESEKPPSAYAEVILNGRLVFRTRTKALSPSPYWNATGERFIRDWSKARLVIVIRDERDREQDPILGLTSIELSTAFSDACQLSRTYPIMGGLGWGLLRLSLLFKAVDAELPKGISSYEVATIRLKGLSLKRPPGWTTNKLAVTVQTDADTTVIPYDAQGDLGHRPSTGRASMSSMRSFASGSSVAEQTVDPTLRPEILDWRLEDRKSLKVIAVEYRHSCFLLFRFVRRSGRLKKDVHLGMACLRLQDVPDNSTCHRTIPIYETSDVNKACDLALDRESALMKGQADPQSESPMLNVSFNLFAGISRAHRKLTKRDERLAHVYEAWQTAQDIGGRQEFLGSKDRSKQVDNLWKGRDPDQGHSKDRDEASNSLDEDEFSSGDDQEDEEEDEETKSTASGISDGAGQHEDAEIAEREIGELENYDEPTSAFGKWMEHNRLLGRQHKGLMQNKFMRNLKTGKDKVQTKVLGSKARAKRERRPHGADIDIEMEGISKL